MKKNISDIFQKMYSSPYISIVRTFFLVLFLIGLAGNANAQIIDSISLSIKEKPTFFIKLDARGSFISNRHVRLSGIKGGLNFKDKLKLGLGYNWLKSNYRPLYNGDYVDLKSSNFYAFIDYVFYKKNTIELNANLQLGLGNIYYQLDGQRLAHSLALFYEQSIAAEYRIINYFGVGLGVGYRLVAFNKNTIDENLSSPVYIARFKLYFGEIYKALNRK